MTVNTILPSFNNFVLQDTNWFTERITFKGWATRDFESQPISRREGIKVMATQFREKKITLDGSVIAADSGTLQILLDNAKAALQQKEGNLVIELGRTYKATATVIDFPDVQYNQSLGQYSIEFTCSDPFSTSAAQTAVIPVPSGQFTISGTTTISGSYQNRPVIVYTPPNPPTAGHTNIQQISFYHVQSGQTVTISGFGSGTDLNYNSSVTIDMDNFLTQDGSTSLNQSGAFPIFQPGTNSFTITASPKAFSGGSISITYSPRYL